MSQLTQEGDTMVDLEKYRQKEAVPPKPAKRKTAKKQAFDRKNEQYHDLIKPRQVWQGYYGYEISVKARRGKNPFLQLMTMKRLKNDQVLKLWRKAVQCPLHYWAPLFASREGLVPLALKEYHSKYPNLKMAKAKALEK
jgi:hypothetical protein